MKKIFVLLFLAIALASPVFAENDKILEFIPKIGYVFSPEITPKDGASVSAGSLLSLGAEILFDTKINLFLGVGGMWGQDTHIKHSNTDMGFTNIYSEGKYKFLINISKKESLFVYPLLQLGIGFPSWNSPNSVHIKDVEIVPGFYWGTGIGVEYRNIVLDFIYACNYSKNRYKELKAGEDGDFYTEDDYIGKEEDPFSYTAFRINIGYKFDF
ncbi:MAG: hypothetical protein IKN62_03145 [Elusimicrobia bacterium]|nr:hypothetical protein [Elusimicrobiota bacterium]